MPPSAADSGAGPRPVAVVGTGAMGSRIARRLLATGHDVVVWNRTRERAEQVGAPVAPTPAAATERAGLVITSVADPAALEAVTSGPEGVAAAAVEHTTVVEMSTVGPPAIARLAALLPVHAAFLDAPVLGSLAEAESGSLRIFVGGAEAVFARCAPILADLGSARRVGPLGSGAAAKLVANAALLGTVALVGETVALGRALGLDDDALFGVLSMTPVAQQAERRRPALASGEYPRRFALSLARKDADLIAEAGGDLRLAAAVRSWLADAETAGLGDLDYTALLAHIAGNAPRP